MYRPFWKKSDKFIGKKEEASEKSSRFLERIVCFLDSDEDQVIIKWVIITSCMQQPALVGADP